MTVCVYLPDGRVGLHVRPPRHRHQRRDERRRARIEVVEPSNTSVSPTTARSACSTTRARWPTPAGRSGTTRWSTATVRARRPGCLADVRRSAGATTTATDRDRPEKSFAKAHYEQHTAVTGSITVGDEIIDIDGFGLRDKSWGPRYWQAITWYRWLPMSFGDDFAMMLSIIGGDDGRAAGSRAWSSRAASTTWSATAASRPTRRRRLPDGHALLGPDRRPRVRGDGRGALDDPAAQPADHPRRRAAAHPHHRGHDPLTSATVAPGSASASTSTRWSTAGRWATDVR